MASESLAPLIQRWHVIKDYTGSDDQYISFTLGNAPQNGITSKRKLGWNTTKMIEEQLNKVITEGKEALIALYNRGEQAMRVETLVDATMQLIHRACDESMPRKIVHNRRRTNYWWTDKIAELRRKCLQSRRKATRARKKKRFSYRTQTAAQHLENVKELRRAIKKSKRRSWLSLTEDVNNEPWGLGYKIVSRKLGALSASQAMKPAVMDNIVKALFPTQTLREADNAAYIDGQISLFT